MVTDVFEVQWEIDYREAQEKCVGMAILAPHKIDGITTIVTPEFFQDEGLRKLWRLVVDLNESSGGVDVVKLGTEARKRGVYDLVGGAAGIAKLIDLPNWSDIEYYAREVARYGEIMKLQRAYLSGIDQLRAIDADPKNVMDMVSARTEGIGNNRDAGFKSIGEIAEKLWKQLTNPSENATEVSRRFSTGMWKLDELIGGFYTRKLYLLGGRSGMGKSALACNFATSAVANGAQVWLCSLEMQGEELAERIITASANINLASWRKKMTSEQLHAVREAKEDLASAALWITDKSSETIRSLAAKARLRKALGGLDMIVIDNLQLIRPMDFRIPRHQQVKQLTEKLKELSKELDVSIIVLCQLAIDAEPTSNRDKGTKTPAVVREPDNTSWGDSKRIIDDCDAALILHRPDKNSSDAKLICTKNRGGVEGSVELVWHGAYQQFKCEATEKLAFQ